MSQRTVGEILLATLSESQPPHELNPYDEVLREVSARAADSRSIGKADIGAVVVWKRSTATSPWSKKLMTMPDAEVRTVTGTAWSIVNDDSRQIPEAGAEALRMLASLPGLGGTGAIASAALLAMAPTRMAIWDRRVHTALSAMERSPGRRKGWYAKYLTTVLQLADEMQAARSGMDRVLPREVDLALYWAADRKDILKELKSVSAQS
ncbi:hypothetical protein [Brachybacterium paraconglomeratum]|uniref:hypothetical protein n=1 Tax=Brachybacterium paraconglomeratum TaxID=173362 RepID=UPI0021A43A01|nr:hypothetical protein [Brachybacterium paraconglomeratum]MCT1908320.1 hypothetical protein [Brachybacterium paraconglomeratum]